MFNEETEHLPNKRLRVKRTTTRTLSKPTTTTKIRSKRHSTNNNNNNNRRQFASLRNLGSTCYINCIIQVMRYSPGFTLSIHRLVKQIDYLKSLNIDLERKINNNNDSVFVKNLHELLIEMSDREKLDRRPAYSPRKFVNTVWQSLSFWSNGTQQDAHEFLQYTIHFINECDLYLKKLHEQYELEVIDLTNDTEELEQENVSQEVISSSDDGRRGRKRKRSETAQIFQNINKCYKTRLKLNSSTTTTTTNVNNYMRIATKGGASLRTMKIENYFKIEKSDYFVKNENYETSEEFFEFQKPKRTRTTSLKLLEAPPQPQSIESIDDIQPFSSNEILTSAKNMPRSKMRTSSLSESSNTPLPSPAEILRKYSSINGHVCEMDKIFKGSSLTLTQCMACDNIRKSPEAFYDRSLPVNTITNESMDLEWIMKCLSNESYLDEDSKYMCDICASKQEAKLHTEYIEMPNILVLHLLPYGITSSYDGNLNTQKLNNRSKLVTCFDCNCEECVKHDDIVNTIKHVFKLYAVVMHSGLSLNSGHYTTYINYQTSNKDIQNDEYNKSDVSNSSCFTGNPEWLHFDDAHVKLLTNNEFQDKIVDSNYDSPYILFYVKDEMRCHV